MKKVFVFLPDGIGFRNFAHTSFKGIAEKMGFDITYWNNTPFDIQQKTGFKELKIEDKTLSPFTIVYSRARKRMELNLFDRKFNETVYNTYNFPQSYKGFRNAFKSLMVDSLVLFGSNEKGIRFVRGKIKELERKTSKYNHCKSQLEIHKPDFIFCTNQRPTQAIAPILAAQDLGIPTGTFIFSWDNLPKATTLVETDYYFVWSEHMKKELLNYCPYVASENVFVTGTPQFESHFDRSLIESKETFFEKYSLDPDKKYICFSGDDIVTSPLDQHYLEDLAQAVRELNAEGHKLGVIYRKCPVDFTDRYQKVLEENSDVIVSIDPLWHPVGSDWNEIMPSKEDFALQANICEHTEFVANIASSMVFDFAAHDKPCLFFNYEQPQLKKGIRDIGQNYKYIHFRSMPSKKAVFWSYEKTDLKKDIVEILKGNELVVSECKSWFEIIVGTEPMKASERIWDGIGEILERSRSTVEV